jgi:hypothetical protein
MTGYYLPLTEDLWQVMTLDVCLDEIDFHSQVEIRYLPAPDQWFVSIWDHAAGELLVNMIPLVCCSPEAPNDLLAPFRFLRSGKGLGSLYCVKAMEETSTPDPAKGNLTEFRVLWSDING